MKKISKLLPIVTIVASFLSSCTINDNKQSINASHDSFSGSTNSEETTTDNTTKHNHNWVSQEIIKSASCIEEGKIKYYCECGESKTETIEKTDHKEVIDKAVSSTCTKTGLTEGKHCSFCNQVLVKQEIIPINPNNHNCYEGKCLDCEKVLYTSGLQFELYGDSYKITSYEGIDEQVIIPSTYDNKPVTSIDSEAFYNCTYLTSIVIPSSVTSVEDSAFEYCSSLVNVYYEGTIENWCKIKFSNKYSNPMYYSSNFYMIENESEYKEVTSIEIPNSIRIISNYQFLGFNNVISINISSSVTTIRDCAFEECSSLVNIEIPNSITLIGESAFYNCSSLESITIPFIGKSSDSNKYLGYIFGASSYDYNSRYVPSSLKEVIILEGCTTIETRAFNGCSSLISIEIPNSVTMVGSSSFYNCNSLKDVYYSGTIEEWCNITFSDSSSNPMYYASHFYMLDSNKEYKEVTSIEIPNTITSIGDYQFYGFSNVTSITIPSSVTSIGSYAFYNCSSLTSIVIPSSVTSIGYHTFYRCSSLTIYCEVSSESSGWSNSWNYNSGTVYWGVTKENIIEQNGIQYIIKDGNAVITRYLGTETNVVIPSTIKVNGTTYNVTEIGEKAFSNNKITSITIPNSITTIGSYAFEYCSSLTSIEIPNSVTLIEKSAFYNCSSLVIITIPFIGKSKDSNECFGYIFGANSYEGNSKYVPSSLKKVIILEGCKTIESKAFNECNSLTSIEIPSSVKTIGNFAFYKCNSLVSMTLPFIGGSKDNNKYLGYIFGADSYEDNSTYIPSRLKEVIILEGCTTIGSYAFCGCFSLTNVVIPSGMTTIENGMFYGCGSLKSVEIPNNVKSIGNFAFYGCDSLTSVIIGDNSKLTTIGYRTFYGCSSLTSITIPNSVTTIDAHTFLNCGSLTIYCEVNEQPDGWDSDWNYNDRPVYWANEWEYVDGVPTIK